MTTQTVPSSSQNKLGRVAAFAYGITAYAIFLVSILYACGFLGNFIVPHSIDSAPLVPLGHALLVNIALLGFFGLQHSGMARKGFKQKWTRIVPQPVERSTYVLFSSLCLLTLFYFWQPMGGTLWQVNNPISVVVLHCLSAIGWLTVLGATFLINHFALFGLQQVWLYLRGKESAPTKFVTPGFYNYVRHPLYVGFLIASWATPSMTVAHLVFALLITLYVLVGIQLEEKDLIAEHGENYKAYRRRVPMLVPSLSRKTKE